MGANKDQKLILPPKLEALFPTGMQVPQLHEKHRMVNAQNLVEELVGQLGSSGDPQVT